MRKKGIRISNKGAAAIEFALVAPLLFFLIFSIIEFGLTLAIDSTLSNSLRSIARQTMVTPYTTADQVKNGMKYDMQNLFSDKMKVTMCVFPTVDSIRVSGLGANPKKLFESPPAWSKASGGCVTGGAAISAADQVNMILIYAAEYEWGGFTKMLEPIIPEHLYSVTVLRSEYFPK